MTLIFSQTKSYFFDMSTCVQNNYYVNTTTPQAVNFFPPEFYTCLQRCRRGTWYNKRQLPFKLPTITFYPMTYYYILCFI